ncbi:MAG: argininosuccinate lyase [Verrucomicrobiota bacterium]|nr:argininosuccinate lyase [Verrucomicrobiota bacterium]
MKTGKRPPARSGRFKSGPAQIVTEFTQSVSFDRRLWVQDIVGSLSHAYMLCSIGVLTGQELVEIQDGLFKIAEEIGAGKFKWRPEMEDVHMCIEAELTRRVPAGAKLHTARSRNDQVALDMRLWVRAEIEQLLGEVRELQRALVSFADRHLNVIIPGYTHLQRAQPVPIAHHMLAYVEMLERDHGRFVDALKRVNVCPLGSGALAGTTLPIDRELVARLLKFVDERDRPRLSMNSMDAVSDRDFVVEFAAASALLGVHMSRLAEDLVLWSTSEFNFVRLPEDYTTGSSLMPQKRNPDVAELVRGKSGRLVGNLVALLTMLKGLPMSYNRDLQEDKQRLFDTADTVRACVRIMAPMIEKTTVNEEACAKAAGDPQLLATDLADYLVRRGVPFREAHHVVGAAVALAEKEGKPLDALTDSEWQRLSPKFASDVKEVFDLHQAMRRRQTPGGPGIREVRRQLKRWQAVLGTKRIR